MQDFFDDTVRESEPSRLLVIVVGAHLEAEVTDRAVGYRLRESIGARLDGHADPLVPVVVTDLWYLNSQPLRLRPTVAIGPPEVNAATAFLAGKLPTALVIEHAYRIQLDPELLDLRACLWGSSPGSTVDAVQCFTDRYLADFLAAADVHA